MDLAKELLAIEKSTYFAIDSDGGWDDTFATVLLLEKLGRLSLITTVGGINDAEGAAHLLSAAADFTSGYSHSVPIVIGGGETQANAGHEHLLKSTWGRTYRQDCSALARRIAPPQSKEPRFLTATTHVGCAAVVAAYLRLLDSLGAGQSLTLLALGPLTNISALMEAATCEQLAKIRLVVMGGAVRVAGNMDGPHQGEFNFVLDIPAAKRVVSSDGWRGGGAIVVPLDCSCCFQAPPLSEQNLDQLRHLSSLLVDTTPCPSESTVTTRCAHILSLLLQPQYLGAWAYDSVAAFVLLHLHPDDGDDKSGHHPLLEAEGTASHHQPKGGAALPPSLRRARLPSESLLPYHMEPMTLVVEGEGRSVEQENVPGERPGLCSGGRGGGAVVRVVTALDTEMYMSYLEKILTAAAAVRA